MNPPQRTRTALDVLVVEHALEQIDKEAVVLRRVVDLHAAKAAGTARVRTDDLCERRRLVRVLSRQT